MKRTALLACLVPVIALSLSCSKGGETVVARMGDRPITAAEIEEQYLSITPTARAPLPTIEDKEQFVRDVISKEILQREAVAIGLDKAPEVQQAYDNTLQRKAWELYYNENVKSKVKVTDDQLRDAYQLQGNTYRLGWIFVRSRTLAEDLASRIAGGADFADLASKYSLDASRTRGGEIGMRALGTLPASVETLVSKMSPGSVEGPVEYGRYYILVKLYEISKSEMPDFEAAKTGLTSLVRARGETAVQRDLADKLARKYDLTFNDDVVDLIVDRTRALYPQEADAGKIPDFSDEELMRVVATYDDAKWYVGTYASRIKSQPDYMRPAYDTDSEAIKNIIGDFITGEIWMVDIKNKGYLERPEVVRAAERAREQAVVTLMHQQVIKDVEVDDAMIRDFYDQNKQDMVSESSALLAAITTQTGEEAQAIYEELQAGGDFAELAREKSFDQVTGAEGGRFPRPIYQRQLEMFPDVQAVVDSLSVGHYAKPMVVPAGFVAGEYMIIKVLGKTPSEPLTFDEVESMLRQRVLQGEQDKAFGEWLTQKMDEYQVEILPEPLDRIDFAALNTQK